MSWFWIVCWLLLLLPTPTGWTLEIWDSCGISMLNIQEASKAGLWFSCGLMAQETGDERQEPRLPFCVLSRNYLLIFFYVGHACASYERACKDGSCVPMSWWCDGVFDCVDKSDEEAAVCGMSVVFTKASIFNSKCNFRQFWQIWSQNISNRRLKL